MSRRDGRSASREFGTVLAVTPAGALTVRASSATLPVEGTAVRDLSGNFEGRVGRIFGPVDRPYLSIRTRRMPRPHEAAALIGSPMVTA